MKKHIIILNPGICPNCGYHNFDCMCKVQQPQSTKPKKTNSAKN